MIVKNEENVLARCLDSVKEIADEIVIVDTGSTDHTKEIVGRFTGKIDDFQWIDDFSAARNYAFSLATQEFILWLDADDFFAERDRQLLLDLKKTLGPVRLTVLPCHITLLLTRRAILYIVSGATGWCAGLAVFAGLERCTSILR